jgi:hypothetical protein
MRNAEHRRPHPLPTCHIAYSTSGKGLVGQRVCVFWAAEATWYSGSIREYSETTETHLVVYDDGDQRQEELSDKTLQWKLLASSAPSPPAQKAAPSAAQKAAPAARRAVAAPRAPQAQAPSHAPRPRPAAPSSKQQRTAATTKGTQTVKTPAAGGKQAASPADDVVVIENTSFVSHPSPARPAAYSTSGKGLVGQRICVFWAAEATWYSGSIRDYTETTETHLVVYDDGDQRHEELTDPSLDWKLLASSAQKAQLLRHGRHGRKLRATPLGRGQQQPAASSRRPPRRLKARRRPKRRQQQAAS